MLKFIGLYAAAVSTLLSYFVMSINRYRSVSKKYFRINLDVKKIFMSAIFYSLVLVCYYGKNIYLTIIGIIISVIYSYIINKKNIKIIFELVQKKFRKRV